MSLEIIIIVMLAGMGWALDRRLDHLSNYINDRISDLETEIICKKSKK